jgi:hypothetical protein
MLFRNAWKNLIIQIADRSKEILFLKTWQPKVVLSLSRPGDSGWDHVKKRQRRFFTQPHPESQGGCAGAPSRSDNGNIIHFDGHSNLEILKYIKNIARIGFFSANQTLRSEIKFCAVFSLHDGSL